jgi:ABC-type multidrug transport system ATPase subunit
MQDDAHVPVLTVKETLLYAAMLRFRETSQTSPKVQAAVSETMDQLGLVHIADSIVGTAASSNISCGQLRRLTIAVELVSRPSLLFLDEPTCKQPLTRLFCQPFHYTSFMSR